MILAFEKVELRLPGFSLRLDLELDGRVIAVFGPSGSGKTSLIELIAGLRRGTTGRVTLDDTILQDHRVPFFVPSRLRHIGYVSQSESLFPHLSARGNIMYGLRTRSDGIREGRVGHVVELLEIESLLDRGVQRLSGGEKQRVAIARALAAGPRLLLLDEPLSGLDSALKEKVLEYLRKIRDELHVPIVYVTHHAEEIMALSDRVLLLNRGEVTGSGRPEEMFQLRQVPEWEVKSE